MDVIRSGSKLKSKLRSSVFGRTRDFAKGERGAVSMWFAILIVPMLGFTFGAIKFSQLAEQRSGMIDAMDAASLGMARQYKLEDIEPCSMSAPKTEELREQKEALIRYGREFFRKNYPSFSQLYSDETLSNKFDVEKHLTFEMDCAKITATASAWSDMGGVLSTYFGVGAIPLNLESEISLPGAGRVEIALVLDVTGSMYNRVDGERKIQTLKDAVKKMLDHPQFYGPEDDAENEFLKISVIPFNTMVNIDPRYKHEDEDGNVTDRATDWMDGYGSKEAESYWHGRNFIYARESTTTVTGWTPNGTAYNSPHVEVLDKKVDHFDLFNSVGSYGARWKGCVEARPFPLDEVPVAPGTQLTQQAYDEIFQQPAFVNGQPWRARKPWSGFSGRKPTAWDPKQAKETYFVPAFAPDDTDCYNGACNYNLGGNGALKAFGYGSGDNFPGFIFDSIPDQYTTSHYDNQYVADRDFTSPWAYDGNDVLRYRNLVLHARERLNCTNNYNQPQSAPLNAAIARTGFSHCDNEYRFRSSYVGVWNSTYNKFYGRYERAPDFRNGSNAHGSDDIPSYGPNYGCGGPLLPLTTSKKDIWARVQQLDASGNTNTAVGLIWGWRTLTPASPFKEASDPRTPEGQLWRKFVVLMTDGDNVFPGRDSHNLSAYTTYGFAAENRLNLSFDPNSAGSAQGAFNTEYDEKTIRMCHRMRASGIKVFTVGFDINRNSRADKMLASCAVDNDAYYFAESEDDLADAFESITSKIVELHISG